MSLVFTLAARNLLQDRLRLFASLLGIVFSTVLVMVQRGLYVGFGGMITTVIDHATADFWIVSKGARYFEDLSLLSSRMQQRLESNNGVSEVIPVVAGFSAWMLPDETMSSIFVVGSDVSAGALVPWNIVSGDVQSVTEPNTVAIDRSYMERLNVSKIGDRVRIRALPATVGAMTEGIRSFTTAPYVFSTVDDARSYTGLPRGFTSFFLIRLKPGMDKDKVRQEILSNESGIQVLTPKDFHNLSRSFWLFRTGAGTALVIGALLAVIVGTVIVAQTLYSSTKEHFFEFATLRAMGASNGYVYRVIILQALISAGAGFLLAAVIALAIVHLTVNTAVQIVITPGLMVMLFVLTVVMCVVSAISAVVSVIRVEPAIVLTR
jgi:putative ABC transport system permease protein